MPGSIDQRVLDRLDAHGDEGLTMGDLVDALVEDGFEEDVVEASLWRLLEQRRLTPHGYIRRVLRTGPGEGKMRRCYELVLRPWSPELDAQLDLELDAV